MLRWPRFVPLFALGAIALARPIPAGAVPVPDYLQTVQTGPVPNNGTRVDFSPAPLPADFFAPGSLPFDGWIYLQGDPLSSLLTGLADTKIQRTADPFSLIDPPGPAVVPVPVELVQLRLTSVQPIHVVIGPQATLWDVFIEALPQQQQGVIQATKTHPNGGSFSSTLYVRPVFTFTRVGNPTEQRVWPAPQPLRLDHLGIPWVHQPSPSLDLFVPPGSNFVPGVQEVVPGDPGSQQRVPRTGTSLPQPGMPNFEHTLTAPQGAPQTPGASPFGLAVLALAIAGAGTVVARARRRSLASS